MRAPETIPVPVKKRRFKDSDHVRRRRDVHRPCISVNLKRGKGRQIPSFIRRQLASEQLSSPTERKKLRAHRPNPTGYLLNKENPKSSSQKPTYICKRLMDFPLSLVEHKRVYFRPEILPVGEKNHKVLAVASRYSSNVERGTWCLDDAGL